MADNADRGPCTLLTLREYTLVIECFSWSMDSNKRLLILAILGLLVLDPKGIYKIKSQSFLHVWFSSFFSLATATCTASGGDAKDPCTPCVFPFKDGSEFQACTEYGSAGKPWCAISVKSDGKYDDWGYCNADCFGTTACSCPRCTESGDDWNCCGTRYFDSPNLGVLKCLRHYLN